MLELRLTPRVVRSYVQGLRTEPCVYCGGPADVLDHIAPRKRGGDNGWANLAPACTFCNGLKGSKSLLGFLGREANRHRYEMAEDVLAERTDWAYL